MNLHELLNFSLPVGSLFGIRIRLHWVLLVLWFYNLNELLQEKALSGPQLLLFWLLSIGLVSLMILLHEFGHCFAARSVGGDADEVLLWPLGGLAFCRTPNLPRAHFIVAAGGPAVTLTLTLLSYFVFRWTVVDEELTGISGAAVKHAHRLLVNFQFFLLVLNLIPLYPLDGGRMLHALLWGFMERRPGSGGYGRATLITVYVSRGCAIVGGIVSFLKFGFLMVFLFVWAWMGTEQLYHRLREGESSDSVFGYDFSGGYTTLGEPARRRRPSLRERWAALRAEQQRKAAARRQPSPEDKARVDALLDKINREGMTALSEEEREFLQRMSKRWQ